MGDHYGANKSNIHQPPETFQRPPETHNIEHRYPTNSAGIVPVPRGSRGPRSLYIKRYDDSFGFTLRHFIVYPPEGIAANDGRHAAVGALLTPMETIFVKHVKDRSPAKRAGLQKGDRLVAVNGIPTKDRTYAQVVQLIVNSPEYLHLLVVPKEEDVLQRFFAETAYNPVSNQSIYPEGPVDRATAQQIITQRIHQVPPSLQVDALSWRSLQQPYLHSDYHQNIRHTPANDYSSSQRSADSVLYSRNPRREEIYAEIHQQPHEIPLRPKCRAAPQVPLYKKMGRRASEGSTLSNRESLESDYSGVVKSDDNSIPDDMLGINYPNTAGCRLSLDVGRRESTSSLSSSIADGSKDSIGSFGSTSTLTGHETDDSVIMSRFRKSVQQKEEFLKTPTNPIEQALIHREFYSRPKKLERAMWPPANETSAASSVVVVNRSSRPNHQNFIRVKNDIDSEREYSLTPPVSGGLANVVPEQRVGSSPKEVGGRSCEMGMQIEAAVAPNFDDSVEMNGAMVKDCDKLEQEKRVYPPGLQFVQKIAKEFENGRPIPDHDPMLTSRTDFSRSELARLSSKKLVPNVNERAHEYETRTTTTTTASNEQRRDNNAALCNVAVVPPSKKVVQRDSRSLDSSGSTSSVPEIVKGKGTGLSGNVLISSGSKYIHCPPPSAENDKPTDTSVNEARNFRVRSNSAESWVAALDRNHHQQQQSQRISRQDAEKSRSKDHGEELPSTLDSAPIDNNKHTISPLIPEPVEHIHLTLPTVSITPPDFSVPPPPMRPNRLDLEGCTNRNYLMLPMRGDLEYVNADDAPVVVKRRPKNTNLADDERAMRRESYLKATEGGRMHIDSDLSDSGELSPQVLRSAHRKWRPPLFPGDIQQLRKLFEDAASSLGESISGNSSSSASLDQEKAVTSPSLHSDRDVIVREGPVHCKILEIDGKRATDRSWKQSWIVLKGPKLFLYKDRHHQSPVGTTDSLDQSLASGVDMRSSVVRIAEDYTKRKNVLRVSAVKPCRSEFLLQAESTEELAELVKTLQKQMASSTEAELEPFTTNQQAVPQLIPACTTIQVQGSHLSPQLNKSSKGSTLRNRSPTGQSPVSKTRKPTQLNTDPTTSPKSKTWRGRMAKQFRKFNQGANSPSSPTAPEGSTFGIPIEECIASQRNMFVPRFVEVCTDIIDDRGLHTIGIYRVPGNNASITALSEEVNRNYDEVPLEDPRWNDLHVVSSLLKSYLRKMPDSLVTIALYPHFIKADKREDPKVRMEELRRLVRSLPKHNYHTLKHIILHLKRVADNCDMNKMEAKNLAIVFGPTIVRPEGENMESMVTNMNNQCKIVESLLTNADWFFPSNDDIDVPPEVPFALPDVSSDDYETNNQVLLNNISKYQALKDPKEKNTALLSSIISAAQRKVKRKPTKGSSSMHDSTKDEPTTPSSPKSFLQQFAHGDIQEESDRVDGLMSNNSNTIPVSVMEIEKRHNKPHEKVPWFNYMTDKADFDRRIQNFKQETEEMLQRPRATEISVKDTRNGSQLSSSAGNVNHNARLSLKPTDLVLTKTHSASNVFSRTANNVDTSRNSLNLMDNNTYMSLPSDNTNNSANKVRSANATNNCSANTRRDRNVIEYYSDSNNSDVVLGSATKNTRYTTRRGSSVENLNSSTLDLNSNGNLKKVKYENEMLQGDTQRRGSLESLNKVSTDDGDNAPMAPVRGWRSVRPPTTAPQRPPRRVYNRL